MYICKWGFFGRGEKKKGGKIRHVCTRMYVCMYVGLSAQGHGETPVDPAKLPSPPPWAEREDARRSSSRLALPLDDRPID